MSSANSPTPSTRCSRSSKRTSPNSSDSQPTPPTSCAPPLAITRTLLDVAHDDPNRDTGELLDRLRVVNGRAIELTEALLLLSRADQRSFTREHVDLSLLAEDAAETLLPLAEKRGITLDVSGSITPLVGSQALLLQMTTNLVHNAIVHNLPDGGAVWVATTTSRGSVVLAVENTGDRLAPELVSTLTEPFQRGSERIHGDQPGVGLGWQSSRASCEPTTGTSPSHHGPPGASPLRCICQARCHMEPCDDAFRGDQQGRPAAQSPRTGSRRGPGPSFASTSPGFANGQLFRLRHPHPMHPEKSSRSSVNASIRRVNSSCHISDRRDQSSAVGTDCREANRGPS